MFPLIVLAADAPYLSAGTGLDYSDVDNRYDEPGLVYEDRKSVV